MKDLRCLIGLHRWQRLHYPEGGTYLRCWRCKVEHDRRPDGGYIIS